MKLEEYLKIESSIQGLDEILLDGVPLWQIVRLKFRWKILGTLAITTRPNIKIWDLLSNNLISLWGITKLFINRSHKTNVFFPHPRLFYVNGMYMERISDPLIDYSGMQDDYLILERHQNGIHKRPRYHGEKVVYLDLVDNTCSLFSRLLKFYYAGKYKHKINELLALLQISFDIKEDVYRPMIVSLVSQFLIKRKLMYPILRVISPKRVFIAPRTTFNHVISICKQYKITSIELEHGITVGETELYSGSYNPLIDPDYFFVFGEANVGPQFGMPVEKVLNIGFPYKKFLNDVGGERFADNCILVASEPHISYQIVEVVEQISKRYPDYEFHIRLHPQERMQEKELERIDALPHVKIVDNTIESFCAISQYSMVMSENSSVLYEAMSLGKKVARLNFGGLHVKESLLIHGGTVLNSVDDFGKFVTEPYSNKRDSKDLYSDFQKEVFDSVI